MKQTQDRKDLKSILGSRARAARASFFLGLALYTAGFLSFVYLFLADFALSVPLAGLIGFAVGTFYLAFGVLWSFVWALAVHVNLLVDDLAAWIGNALHGAVRMARERVTQGDAVDVEFVRRQVDTLVAEQTKKLGEGAWVPMVNQTAPLVAREGLRALLTFVTGRLWKSDELTVEMLEQGLTRFSGEAAVFWLRRILWTAMALLIAVAVLAIGSPLALAYLIRALIS